MADSSGSVSGVGGAGGANSTSGSAAAEAAAATQAGALDGLADSMVDAATDPTGVDVDALGQAVAALQAQAPSPDIAQDLQRAVEAQLSPVQVGQLQGAIDRAVTSGTVASALDAANASPLAGAAPAGLVNAKGQSIDQCGNPVATLSTNRAVSADQTEYAKAVEHVGRIVGGPISGPLYAGTYLAGADKPTLDTVYAVGKVFDAARGAPSVRGVDPTPANRNFT